MLIRQTFQYLPAQLLGPLAQLAAIVLWTHWLAPEAFGTFTLALATQEIVYLLLLSFWSYYLLRFLPSAQAAVRARMDVIERWLFLCNVLLQAAVLLLVMRQVQGNWPARDLFGVLLAFTFTRSYCSHLAERTRASGAIVRYTILQTLGPVGGLLIGAIWARMATLGPEQVLAAYAIAQGLSLLLVLPGARLAATLKPIDTRLLQHALRYGVPLAASGLLAWFPGNGIRFVVEHQLGVAAVGVFSVGWTLGQRGCGFAAMLVTAAAFPLVLRLEAEGHYHQAMRQVALNGALLCAVLFPTLAGLVLLAPSLTELAISAPYVSATLTILPLAALAGTVKNLRIHFANQAFLLAQKTHWTLALDAVETLLFLAAVAGGLRVLGLAGAAWGALLAVSVGALLAFALAIFRFGMPFPGAHLLRILIATALMSALLRALPSLPGWGGLIGTTALAGTLYLGALALLYRRELQALRKP
ncbi:MAG TPA: oligosaccharide flippase family protein [Stenotrophomonas sp.]